MEPKQLAYEQQRQVDSARHDELKKAINFCSTNAVNHVNGSTVSVHSFSNWKVSGAPARH